MGSENTAAFDLQCHTCTPLLEIATSRSPASPDAYQSQCAWARAGAVFTGWELPSFCQALKNMASLNRAWNIATGALSADEAAISVVAGNIGNANTPGYTTEAVKWGSADTVTVNGHSSGSGVTVQGIVSQRDRLLNQRIDQQTQDQSAAAERLTALNDLQ